jgi:alpha-tubulin suppressor-like RCC1 family protein
MGADMVVRRMAAARAVVALAVLAAPLAVAGNAAGAAAPGTLTTWGSNAFGQLGNGTTSATPVGPGAVAGLTDVVDVHGGREHVVALTADATVYTWGSNKEGQLGLGDSSNRSTPTVVPGLCPGSQVTAVETGHNSTLALCGDGTVWAWGLNADGQLGDGSTTLRRSPVRVSGLTDAVAIAAGRDMAYAVRAGGTLVAWGDNQYGELGNGSTVDSSTPVAVPALTNVAGIAGGRNHALALLADGSVRAFGANTYGQLGDGSTVNRSTAVPVLGLSSRVVEVIAGAHHSYALRDDGQVLSWGRNYRDELGNGSTAASTRPVSVTGVSSAASIGSGRDHGLAVMTDGTVMAWGYNANGQLGDGTTTNRSVAVVVPGVSGATKAGGGGGEYSVVLGGQVGNRPPTARAAVTCHQLACTFDGSASTDPDGTITDYSWDFGDGSALGSGPTLTHQFAAVGSYTVTLTVTDDAAASGRAVSTVSVSDASIVFRGARTFDGSTVRPTVTVPTQAAPGDQLLLFLTTGRAATAATPAGWTLQRSVSDGTDVRGWVFSRIAVIGTAGSTVAVPLDATSKASATILAYGGAGQPAGVLGSAETGTTALHKAPSALDVTSGSTVVHLWADKVAASHGWSLPATVTARSTTPGVGTSGILTSVSADASGVAAGTWPGVTADAGTASAKAVAWTVVLPPA